LHWLILTWVKYVTNGAVIKNHDPAQIRLDLGEILDVDPIAKCAVLSIVSSSEVLALNLQPVDDRIGILLHRGGENDQIVPFTDLSQNQYSEAGPWQL
jgi:hypothetical protein